MKKIIAMIIMLTLALTLTACSSGLSGTYEGEAKYGKISIDFKSSGKCTWHESGSVYEGTYKKTDDGYYLFIKGSGFASDSEFNAVKSGNDLIIEVYKADVRFVKK